MVMNQTTGGRQRICVPDNYQKLVSLIYRIIHLLLFPLMQYNFCHQIIFHIFSKTLKSYSFTFTCRYDLPNMTGPTYVTIGVDIKDIPKVTMILTPHLQ